MATKNDIQMYSAHNEGKSVVTEIFIRNPEKKNLEVYDFSIKKCPYQKIRWYR